METNCKNNKYNLDHVYCHSNDSNYIRATKSSGAVDIMTLLKENKQLKAMLLLHLDLIQEQSDQLQAKDKLLASLKEENENLRSKIENLEEEKIAGSKIGLSTVQENNKLNIGISGRNSYHRVHGKNQESTDAYKKINKNVHNNKHEDKKENLAEYSNTENQRNNKIINSDDKSSTASTATITTRSRHTPTPPGGQISVQNDKYKVIEENVNSGSIIGQCNGKPISKIMLHRVKIPSNIFPNKSNNFGDKNDSEISSFNMQLASLFENKEESPKSSLSSPTLLPPASRSPRCFRKITSPTNLSLTQPLIKRSKISKTLSDTKFESIESPLSPLLDPKIEMEIKEEIKQEDTDDGFSCESSGPDTEPIRRFIRCKSRQSTGESSACNIEQLSEIVLSSNSVQDSQTEALSPISKNLNNSSKNLSILNNSQTSNLGSSNLSSRSSIGENGRRKITYLTTRRMYSAREWTTEGIPAEEFTSIKEEEEALKAEQPMLEIPKWTVKEVAHLYSIEGTEDLSDETFRKRHAKLEYDEKRRKKWDVQRIREQRTIERLKRRHCKEELIETENQDLISFYPAPDQIKFIQISDELPVEAFGGELIPRLSPSEFQLPWKKHSHSSRINEIHLTNVSDNQTDNQHYNLKYQHRNQNSFNDSSFAVNSTSSVLSNATTNSTFLFIKKRKKPQSTSIRKQNLKNNVNTSNVNSTNNLSFNLSISSTSSKSNLFSNITSPSRSIEERNIPTTVDSNIVEKVQHSSFLNNNDHINL